MRTFYGVLAGLLASSPAYSDVASTTSLNITPSDWLNIIALLVGPTIGVAITIIYQRIQEKKRNKLWVLGTLIANRHQIIHSDNVKAMNTIDLVFAHDRAVRAAWADFVAAVRNQTLNDESRIKSYNAMIDAMCGALGYSSAIRYLDFERVIYDPAPAKTKAFEDEFIGILRAGKEYIESEMRKSKPELPKP